MIAVTFPMVHTWPILVTITAILMQAPISVCLSSCYCHALWFDFAALQFDLRSLAHTTNGCFWSPIPTSNLVRLKSYVEARRAFWLLVCCCFSAGNTDTDQSSWQCHLTSASYHTIVYSTIWYVIQFLLYRYFWNLKQARKTFFIYLDIKLYGFASKALIMILLIHNLYLHNIPALIV